MSRDSNTPRHARVHQQPAGRRLQHAVLPVALGGVMAGSLWLAADAAAAPASHHPCPSDGSARSDARPADAGRWDGSNTAWHSRDASDDWHSRDGQYSPDRWHHYDGRHDYDAWHHWRDHTGEHWYARHSGAVVKRAPARPDRATSTQTERKTSDTVQVDAAHVGAANIDAARRLAAPAAREGAHHREQPERPARSAASAAAPHAATRPSRAGATRQLSTAARSNLAAADTAQPSTDYVTLYGAIGGAALAALLGMGGVAIWRRRGTDIV